MFGEIKDLATLKSRALELALGVGAITPLQPNNATMPDAEEVVKRAKIYEDYLKEGVNISQSQGQDNFLSTISVMPLIWNLKSEGKDISPEWRTFFEKSGIDPSLVDALCGKKEESTEEKVDDLCDAVNQCQELNIDGVIVRQWLHPELRNSKHRFETIRNGEIVSTGDNFPIVIFETF